MVLVHSCKNNFTAQKQAPIGQQVSPPLPTRLLNPSNLMLSSVLNMPSATPGPLKSLMTLVMSRPSAPLKESVSWPAPGTTKSTALYWSACAWRPITGREEAVEVSVSDKIWWRNQNLSILLKCQSVLPLQCSLIYTLNIEIKLLLSSAHQKTMRLLSALLNVKICKSINKPQGQGTARRGSICRHVGKGWDGGSSLLN